MRCAGGHALNSRREPLIQPSSAAAPGPHPFSPTPLQPHARTPADPVIRDTLYPANQFRCAQVSRRQAPRSGRGCWAVLRRWWSVPRGWSRARAWRLTTCYASLRVFATPRCRVRRRQRACSRADRALGVRVRIRLFCSHCTNQTPPHRIPIHTQPPQCALLTLAEWCETFVIPQTDPRVALRWVPPLLTSAPRRVAHACQRVFASRCLSSTFSPRTPLQPSCGCNPVQQPLAALLQPAAAACPLRCRRGALGVRVKPEWPGVVPAWSAVGPYRCACARMRPNACWPRCVAQRPRQQQQTSGRDGFPCLPCLVLPARVCTARLGTCGGREKRDLAGSGRAVLLVNDAALAGYRASRPTAVTMTTPLTHPHTITTAMPACPACRSEVWLKHEYSAVQDPPAGWANGW